MRVTKRDWYDKHGGFRNSLCWRRQRGGSWQYFVKIDPFTPPKGEGTKPERLADFYAPGPDEDPPVEDWYGEDLP